MNNIIATSTGFGSCATRNIGLPIEFGRSYLNVFCICRKKVTANIDFYKKISYNIIKFKRGEEDAEEI